MIPTWKVLYYTSESHDNPVQLFLDNLESREQSKILRILQYIREYGLISVLPHVKKLSGLSLWEIRVLGRDSIRVLYVVPTELTVLVLHGFRKKTQKTPKKEIRMALERYRDWKARREPGIDK
jgi:phage-related protein